MRPRLLVASFAAVSLAAPAPARHAAAAPDPATIAARHLARRRLVFRQAYAPDVVLSAIVYSSGYPEYLVALRRSKDGYAIVSVGPEQSIWTYGMVEMFRSRAWRMVKFYKGRGSIDMSDAEADRLAAKVPPDPRDLRLSGCTVAIEPGLAGAVVEGWQRLSLRVPPLKPTGVAATLGSYLLRTGTDEREVFGYPFAPRGDPDQRLIALVESLRRSCQSGQVRRDDVEEALAGR